MSGVREVQDAPERRARVTAFSQQLFGHLPRADQQRWGEVYLRGLLATPGKKSVRQMARTVTASPTAHQSLQQFVNSSPWEWDLTRRELARWVAHRLAVRAWTIAPVILPKRGDHSVGVHRRFVREQGRTVNCQLGLGLFLAGGTEQVPVDWQLQLPDRWTSDPEARRRARIADGARTQPLWAHALDLVDGLAGQPEVGRAPVVADLTAVTDVVPLVERLQGRGHPFVLAVDGQLPLALPGAGRAGCEAAPDVSVRRLLLKGGSRHPRASVSTGQYGRSHRLDVISSPADITGLRPDGGRVSSVGRAFAVWDPARQRLGRIWLTNLPRHRVVELLALAGLREGALAAISTLGDQYGLLDFEGRGFPGWHRHMTLVAAAYAYGLMSGAGSTPAPVREHLVAA